ncbi:SDR family NAD(P)-dependent oxidoreductase [Chitinasiproducens palmae]|uniref:SDR family NAD(P)-dependent oxidoreductase n=1 Tax=Chitinasiproducens palmae TaxID=1770053 RepID=UPI002E25C43F
MLRNVDLHGKRFLVTGVSSGIGCQTARALAARGAEVIGTARDRAKAKDLTEKRGGKIDVVELDLADLGSVRHCAAALVADGRRLDAIIANAGVMALPLQRTKDGFEAQLGINHLGHFVLVNRIASLLSDGGRLVTVSSNGHRWADVNIDDPNFEQRPYDPWVSYGGSKTAVSLFAVEFDRRHRARGVRACSLMPGVANTGLAKHLSQGDLAALGTRIAAELGTAGQSFAFKTIPQVAATSVWAAVVANAEDIGGRYCQDCQVAPVDDAPGIRFGVMSHALDADRAKRLWAKSEELVQERFGETV